MTHDRDRHADEDNFLDHKHVFVSVSLLDATEFAHTINHYPNLRATGCPEHVTASFQCIVSMVADIAIISHREAESGLLFPNLLHYRQVIQVINKFRRMHMESRNSSAQWDEFLNSFAQALAGFLAGRHGRKSLSALLLLSQTPAVLKQWQDLDDQLIMSSLHISNGRRRKYDRELQSGTGGLCILESTALRDVLQAVLLVMRPGDPVPELCLGYQIVPTLWDQATSNAEARPRNIVVRSYQTSSKALGRKDFQTEEFILRGPDGENHVMRWSPKSGYVHLTPIWKILGRGTADIQQVVRVLGKSYPRNTFIRLTGGTNEIKGTWARKGIAFVLAKTICYHIRHHLCSIFGTGFAEACIAPTDQRFGKTSLDIEDYKRI